MPFSFAWNEAVPADTDLANTLGDVIRKFKTQVRERVDVEHFFPLTDTAATGYHRPGSGKVFLQTTTPANNVNAPGALWIHTTTGVVKYDSGVAWVDFNSGVPSGTIVMWSGSIASIPTGWKLCDGTAGTPDLRSKFIRGAPPATDPGATGGSDTHSHVMGPMTPASVVVTVCQTTPTVNVATAAHNHQDFSDTVDSRPAFFELAFIMKV